MKQYDYILLDWDGNIAKTLDLWLVCFKQTLAAHGMSFTNAEIVAKFGGFINNLVATGLTPEQAQTIYSQAFELCAQKYNEVKLYPGALDTIKQLHKNGKKLALITSSLRRIVEPPFYKNGLDAMFDSFICADDVTQRKPHPEPLQKALSQLGGHAANAVMMGDSQHDIAAANAAGTDSILFFPAHNKSFYKLNDLQTHNPTHIVNSFKSILTIIK